MSCISSTAPIDINTDNITGKCDYKCNYTYKYYNSSCNATNMGEYISLSYDTSTIAPVIYNSSEYNVSEVRIYTQSLHSYSGQKTDAELIIIHTSTNGVNPLLVCIPLTNNNTYTEGSEILTTIINSVASNAPADGETTTININNYNLNSFVKKAYFFTYTATLPYQPCTGTNEYIVYSLKNASYINDNTLALLSTIITLNDYTIQTGTSLFLNSRGPDLSKNENIYIDCQPVGSSDDTTTMTTGTSPPITVDELVNNMWFQIIIGFIIFLVILKLMKQIINYLDPFTNTVIGLKN